MQEKLMEETKMEQATEQNSAEQALEQNNGKKKKKRGSCLLPFLIVLGIVFGGYAIYFIWLLSPHIETEFASTEEFIEYGGYICVDIPESASDIKYYCNDMYFTIESACSYVISDEKEFEAFLEVNDFEIKSDETVAHYIADPPVFGGEIDIQDWYSYVVEDDIRDYYVLNYYSFDGSYRTLIADEETGRIVVIKLVTL